MAIFNPGNCHGGQWALSQVWRYVDRSASLAEITEPGFVPKGWLSLNDIVMVLAADGDAFVSVKELTAAGEPVFSFFRSAAPPVQHVTRKAA